MSHLSCISVLMCTLCLKHGVADVYLCAKNSGVDILMLCCIGGVSVECQDNDEIVDIEGGLPAKNNSCDRSASDTAVELAAAVAKVPECRLKEWSQQSAGQSPAVCGAAFWRSGWRRKLCRCSECLVSITALFKKAAVY